jgi:predicted RNA-binding protein YlxR (DUF448 family)
MVSQDDSADALKGTSRKCIASGEVKDKSALLRFVVTPDGMLIADVLEKLPGKGIWVTCDKELLQKAIRDNLFSRAARKPVSVSETLLEDIEQMLINRDLVSLVVTKFNQEKRSLKTAMKNGFTSTVLRTLKDCPRN